jgi:hypothetical protein
VISLFVAELQNNITIKETLTKIPYLKKTNPKIDRQRKLRYHFLGM